MSYARLGIVLGIVLLACASAFGADPVSPAVQVAISYGPNKTVMISGVIVGDGDLVLTQANVLRGARDIVVALTNNDVIDARLEWVDSSRNVALLRMERAVRAPLDALSSLPPGGIAAFVLGAPETFKTTKIYVQLEPISGRPAWSILPPIAPAFRGAPVLSLSGTLLGIVIEQREGEAAEGVPITELLALIAGAPVQNILSKAGAEQTAVPSKAATEQTADAQPVTAASARKTGAEQTADTPPGTALPAKKAGAADEPEVGKKTEEASVAASKPAVPVAKPAEQAPPEAGREPSREQAAAKATETAEQAAAKQAPEGVKAVLAATAASDPTGKTLPDKTAPERTAPDKPTPDKTTPDQKTPDRTAPDRTAPDKANAAEAPEGRKNVARGVSAGEENAIKQAPAGAKESLAAAPVGADTAATSPIDQWKQRIATEPNDSQLRFSFANALMAGGLYREAIGVLQQAQKDFPEDARVYWYLGQVLWQQGMRKADGSPRRGMERGAYAGCLAAFKMFLERAPNDPHAADARVLLEALRKAKR